MRYSDADVIGLAILKDLERFRSIVEHNEASPDWVVRMCEATVAEYTQFKKRAEWLKQIQEVSS